MLTVGSPNTGRPRKHLLADVAELADALAFRCQWPTAVGVRVPPSASRVELTLMMAPTGCANYDSDSVGADDGPASKENATR